MTPFDRNRSPGSPNPEPDGNMYETSVYQYDTKSLDDAHKKSGNKSGPSKVACCLCGRSHKLEYYDVEFYQPEEDEIRKKNDYVFVTLDHVKSGCEAFVCPACFPHLLLADVVLHDTPGLRRPVTVSPSSKVKDALELRYEVIHPRSRR